MPLRFRQLNYSFNLGQKFCMTLFGLNLFFGYGNNLVAKTVKFGSLGFWNGIHNSVVAASEPLRIDCEVIAHLIRIDATKGPGSPCSRQFDEFSSPFVLSSDLKLASILGVSALGEIVSHKSASDTATNGTRDKTDKHVLKRLPIHLRLLWGLIGGLIGGPLGVWIYFRFIDQPESGQLELPYSIRPNTQLLVLVLLGYGIYWGASLLAA